MNMNVFTIRDDGEYRYLDLTQDMDELSEILRTVLNKWNEVQCRNEAFLASKEFPAHKLRAMAETVITVCDKALEHQLEG